jgi:uncharacterized protein YchJ
MAEEALRSVREWAAAWSAQDADRYLAAYAPDFKPPDGESRAAWEAQRRERLTAPKFIRVEIADARARVEDDHHVVVSFRQAYRASHLEVTSAKTMGLVKLDGRWLIASERSGR